MRKYALIITLLLFSILNLYSQNLEWVKSMGGTLDDKSYSIAVDSYENVYTTGYFTGTVDFDPGAGIFNLISQGSGDVFICKSDSNGNLVWAKSFGGTSNDYGYSIGLDATGNVYVSGFFFGTADFDPGTGVFNMVSAGSEDIFIVKLDNNGNFCWAKRIGGTDVDVCYSMAVSLTGNVYTTGEFSGTGDFDPGTSTVNLTSAGTKDIFISKLDASGNYIWAKRIGAGGTDYSTAITIDNSENTCLTGTFGGTVDFNPGPGTTSLTSAGMDDIFIVKLDANGNMTWAKRMGGPYSDKSYAITIDLNGNVLTTGTFLATADFDPGIGIYNLTVTGPSNSMFISKLDINGNFCWAKKIGGTAVDFSLAIATDTIGNVFTTGYFNGTTDFDPGNEICSLTSAGGFELFVSKLTTDGSFIWARRMGGIDEESGNSIKIDKYGNIYIAGHFAYTADFDPGPGTYILTPVGWFDIFILKLRPQGVTGIVYNDYDHDCQKDSYETGIANRLVSIDSGNYITQTNEFGVWYIESIPAGNHTATVDTSGYWVQTCPSAHIFTVTNPEFLTVVNNFSLISTLACANPDVSITMPFIRRCLSNTIYVNACNLHYATGAIGSAYVDVKLDSLITPTSSSIIYTAMGNNIYRFQVGNLNPGQSVSFSIDCIVSCDALNSQTLCMQANLYPADTCVLDTVREPYPSNFTPCDLPWDKSSLSVEGYCQNDSVYFIVTNTGAPGNGDMDCFAPVRIYIDGVYTYLDSIQLAGGDSMVFVFAGNGKTWRLEADQHPLHPGNSHPNATIEACGNISNWTPNLVTILPQDDADPVVDIYCGLVTGSYDPNDKTGYPLGVTTEHHIIPNQQLQYVIRFQNTGTDTAFTVVIRDTLDLNLDVFSVVPGAASHNYTFQMYGPRVLEWTFNNILLPDSNHNQEESHGFITYTVNQNHNLSNGTYIYNSANIYFDLNAPVITNQTLHSINDKLQTNITSIPSIKENVKNVFLYPNPTNEKLHVLTNNNKNNPVSITIFDMQGKKVKQLSTKQNEIIIDISELEQGVYGIRVVGNKVNCSERFVKL